MKEHKSGITICLISLLIFPLLSCAMEQELAKPLDLKQSKIESVFSVKQQKLLVSKGKQHICEADNAAMLSAFELKKIYLKNLNYIATVSRKTYSPISTANNKMLELFYYEVEFKDFPLIMANHFPFLAKQEFVTSYIANNKAPTSCFIFNGRNKLNLLCHYGMKQYPEMVDIIRSLK